MSLFKYFGQQQDADGAKLWWPGGPDGYPFIGGQPPVTSQDEYEDLKLSGKMRANTFYLAKAEDLQTYVEVKDKIVNGWFIQLDRQPSWDEETKGMRIYLEWVELAYEAPQPKRTGAYSNGKDTNIVEIPVTRLAGLQAPISETGW
jgi:hypothetical protein